MKSLLATDKYNKMQSYLESNYQEEFIFAEKLASNTRIESDLSPAKKEREFTDLFNNLDNTFQESLFKLIDEKSLNDVDVYKKANIDRRLFSKIKSNKDYQPSKTTAVSFCIALELNLDETKDLLKKAGFPLSKSSKFDIIIEYFIINENYDLYEINKVLFVFGQKTLA